MFPLLIPDYMRCMPNAGVKRITEWIGPIEQSMLAFQINNPTRMAYYLANVAHESLELLALEENLRYRPERLLAFFPKRVKDLAEAKALCAAGPEAVANHVYAGRMGNGDKASGDGWRYRARGPIGITGHDNYAAASVACCGDADTLLTNPEFLALPDFGAASSAWYWAQAKCNEAADESNFDAACDLVNIGKRTLAKGDSNGYKAREEYLQAFQKALL